MANKRRSKASGVRRGHRHLEKVPVNEIHRELKRRRAEAERLSRHRRKLAAKLENLDRRIAACDGLKAGRGVGTGALTRRQNNATLVDSLAALLKGTTMSVTEMTRKVQEAGYKTNSPNFRTIVNAALIAHKDVFKNVSRGKYTTK